MTYPAVILAGGRGKRLSALTDRIPKPLLPVLGEPVICHALTLLCKAGCDSALISVGYMKEKIMNRLGGTFCGMELGYGTEDIPLGTAGAVKACRDRLTDNFIVMSSDVVTDFDLVDAVKFHRESNADVTLLLCKRPDPRAYGIAVCEKSGRILRFLEKPGWDRVFSDRINTGIYIIKKSVLDLVPDGREFDFGKELFPLLLKEGKRMFGITLPGYWCDIGSARDYLKCNLDAYSGLVRLEGKRRRVPECRNSVIGEGVILGKGTSLEECTVGDGATFGAGCRLYRCIVGEGAAVADRVTAEEGSIIAPFARVPSGTHIAQGQCFSSNNEKKRTEMSYGRYGISFKDGTAKADISAYGASLASALGCAAAPIVSGTVGISHDGRQASRRFAEIFASSLCLCGRNVCYMDKASQSLTSFAASRLGCDITLRVAQKPEEPGYAFISFTDGFGLLPSREFENALLSGLGAPSVAEKAGEVEGAEGLEALYVRELAEQGELSGITPGLCQFEDRELAIRAIEKMSGRIALPNEPCFAVLDPSSRFILYDGEVFADIYKCIEIIISLSDKDELPGISLSYSSPPVLSHIARSKGIEPVFRLTRPSASAYDRRARQIAARLPFLTDPLFCGIRTLSLLNRAGLTLKEAFEGSLPLCVKQERVAVPDGAKAALLSSLYEEYLPYQISAADGISLVLENGTCTVMANDGGDISLTVCGATEEAAEDVCHRALEKIKELMKERH